MRVFGIAGFKNAGKTTLVVDLIRHFREQGVSVATIKHAHHEFDIDHPGKDSFQHREAGAGEVIVCSRKRVAQITELDDQPEPTLDELLGRLREVDLVLVEGFKRESHPRLELRRDESDAPRLAGDDPGILLLVTDSGSDEAPVPVMKRDDVAGIATFIVANAREVSGSDPGE